MTGLLMRGDWATLAPVSATDRQAMINRAIGNRVSTAQLPDAMPLLRALPAKLHGRQSASTNKKGAR
jgi:hypothetical protein